MEQSGTRPARFGVSRVILLVGISAIVLLLTASGALFAWLDDPEEPPAAASRVQVLEPPRPLAEVALTSQTGDAMALGDLRGHPVLLFFGYTYCPDVCPTTLAGFRAVKRELGAAGEAVRFVFVSLDGSRDTPDVLDAYLSQFDPAFIGLTGPEDDVRSLGRDFSLYFARAEASGSAAGYLVDHTAFTYLIDPDGRLRTIYPADAPLDRIVADLEAMLG